MSETTAEASQAEPRGRLVQFPTPPHSATMTGSARRWWVVAGAALALLVIAAIAWHAMSHRANVVYTSVPLTRGSITRAVTATGTVNPELTIIVGSYVSGVIQELYCDYNTQVKKGQVCAKIDPRPYQTIVDQNKANLAVAKAQLEKDKAALRYAKVAMDRDAWLVKSNAISKDAYDNAVSVHDQAQAQIAFDEATIQQHQAQLDAAQVNLDYTNITSPVDGTVVSRNVTMGQTVAASFQTPTLFLIASDLTRMEVDTNVSESDVGGIKVGQKSTFSVDAYPKRTFQGTVSQVRQSPQTVQNVVTYDIVVAVSNQGLALKPGLTAATRIVVDQRDDVLRIPNAALRYRPSAAASRGASDQTSIWVLREGKPVAVPIVTGLDDESYTEIASGELQPDDQVITAEQNATSTTVMPRLRLR